MLASRTKRGCETAHEMAIERLVQLERSWKLNRTLQKKKGRRRKTLPKEEGFIVHEHFRKHVKRASREVLRFRLTKKKKRKKTKEKKKKKKKANVKTTNTTSTTTTRFNEEDVGFLDHYAKSRWETVLLELTFEASRSLRGGKDAVASHLSALGVLYENEDDENDNNWYVPTVLSAGLSSVSTTSSAKSALARIDGHIIVET
ncbi:unnamed protein product [Bathycoccus prasinos]